MNSKEVKTNDIKLKVTRYGSRAYCIYYKSNKWWKPWTMICQVYGYAPPDYTQPVLFFNYDEAVKYAKELKKNPILIDEHYDYWDKEYSKRQKEYKRISKGLIL